MPPEVMTRSFDLQRRQERLHLLLPLLHRQQDDEVEDRQDEHERHELQPRAGAALRGRGHGQQIGKSRIPNPKSEVKLIMNRETGGKPSEGTPA